VRFIFWQCRPEKPNRPMALTCNKDTVWYGLTHYAGYIWWIIFNRIVESKIHTISILMHKMHIFSTKLLYTVHECLFSDTQAENFENPKCYDCKEPKRERERLCMHSELFWDRNHWIKTDIVIYSTCIPYAANVNTAVCRMVVEKQNTYGEPRVLHLHWP
jgi:hypothetical protein